LSFRVRKVASARGGSAPLDEHPTQDLGFYYNAGLLVTVSRLG
jgi:hypothetical protein